MPDPAVNGDANETASNAGAKIVILVFFLMAFGLGAIATMIQLKNRQAQEQLVAPWQAVTEDGKTARYTIADDQMNPNGVLTDWERAELASEIAPFLNEYLRIRYSTGIENWEEQQQKSRTLIADVAREVGINARGNLRFISTRPRSWVPWDNSRRDLRRKYNEVTNIFEFANLTRRQIIAFVLRIEDQYSFLKIRNLEMSRKEDGAGSASDAWKAKMTAVWYTLRKDDT